MTVHLAHNHVTLALHCLRAGSQTGAHPLLVLHGLGDRSPATCPDWAEQWRGDIQALDFTGHGASTLPVGGGYSAELLMADADAALARLGPSTVIGFGLGAYVALLVAGGRPDLVRGAVLCDGPGLAGGATHPTSVIVHPHRPLAGNTPDPWALVELASDLRPPDYATTFVRLALAGSTNTANDGPGLDEPIVCCVRSRAPWVDAVVDEPGVARAPSVSEALARFV